jgi:hypothetical protein
LVEGWSALHLFGVDLTKPAEGGLADQLSGKRVLIMAAGAASWRPWGVPKLYVRSEGVGLAPLWKANV